MSMDTRYAGKSVDEWIDILREGTLPERSAAALAIAELGPSALLAKNALLRASYDSDISLQVAARIAMGLVELPVENRRKILFHLLDSDEEIQQQVLYSLAELGFSPSTEGTPAPEQVAIQATPSPVVLPTTPSTVTPQPPTQTSQPQTPDIVVAHMIPWWLIVGAVTLCLLIAWSLRSVWWVKWCMLGGTLAFAGLLFLVRSRLQKGRIGPNQYRARMRVAWPGMAATLAGSLLGFVFPVGTIFIDNESGFDVRLMLDDNEWLPVQSGESRITGLTKGTYQVSVRALDGKQVMDVHSIEVTGCRRYVLNVLAAQTYFHGSISYGTAKESKLDVLNSRWFELPSVDCLFRDPPATITVEVKKNGMHLPPTTTRSFVTKGAPPRLRGHE